MFREYSILKRHVEKWKLYFFCHYEKYFHFLTTTAITLPLETGVRIPRN